MIAALPRGLDALAAVGLPSALVLDPTGWEDRLDAVIAHGLAGLLAEAWRAGTVTLDDAALDRLERRLVAEALLAVRLEAEILRLAPVLERYQGVVLKGAGLAHGAYPDAAWRPFTDIDLLVPTRWLPAVIERLVACGYGRPLAEPCPGFLVRVGKATVLQHPTGLTIDLHRTLASGNLGEGIDIDELSADRIIVAAGAVPIPAPSWPAHLIEVALHAIVGDGLARALSLRDVVQLAAHPSVEPRTVLAMADRWSVGPTVAASLLVAHASLGVPVPDGFIAGLAPSAEVERLLRPGPQGTRSARLRLDELHRGGVRRRLVLARSLLVPDRAFLRWRYADGPAPRLYLRRWRHLAARRKEGLLP